MARLRLHAALASIAVACIVGRYHYVIDVLAGVGLGAILLAMFLSLMIVGRKLMLSARAWVLFVLLVIAALVAYYVLSDRHTPFTTDAYVQAYVIQVAPRVEGQVVHIYVRENQAVKKGELLFEIDRRPFEHRVAFLEAKRVAAIQQVAQMESELSAAKADDARLVILFAFARTSRAFPSRWPDAGNDDQAPVDDKGRGHLNAAAGAQ